MWHGRVDRGGGVSAISTNWSESYPRRARIRHRWNSGFPINHLLPLRSAHFPALPTGGFQAQAFRLRGDHSGCGLLQPLESESASGPKRPGGTKKRRRRQHGAPRTRRRLRFRRFLPVSYVLNSNVGVLTDLHKV